MESTLLTDAEIPAQDLELAIRALEAQRASLGDLAVDVAIAALRGRLRTLGLATPSPDSDLAGERKLVTIMFADLSGFTALSEKLDPEHVRALMNACFDSLVPVVESYGGTVDKFIGDEIMALFGAPKTREHDAGNCLRAALDMMESLKGFNAQHDCSLGMHIGINTGTVVAGGLGSEGRQQYSVLGDAVNLAARLEDASETGQILVGPNTYRLTSFAFGYQPLSPIRLKGKSAPVPVYLLLGRIPAAEGGRGFEGLHSPLVGRESEMRFLLDAVQSLRTGQGRLIGLGGEPGIGKSRLMTEVRQLSQPDIRWVEGRALSYSQGMPYWMAQNALDALLGISPEATPRELGAALRSSLEQRFPLQTDFDLVFPYLASMRGISLDDNTSEMLAHVAPEAMQRRIRFAFQLLVRTVCGSQGMVFVCEDLHWADPSTLGLLESIIPLIQELPLMIVCLFRTQEGAAQDWFRRVSAERSDLSLQMELGPLVEGESRRLIDNLLHVENLPESTQELLLGKAEGNPFFLEEILRSLVDAGLVVVEEGHAKASREITHLDVPDTLQGVIAARIDRLPSEDKRTLQTASVIGRVFQRPVLAYLLQRQKAPDYVDTCLSDLQRRELIRRRAELEYIFKHAVTQEVSYNSLLMATRANLHHIAAEAIEALFPEHLEELSPTLAYHYQRAALRQKALHYSVLAADRARKAYANSEAMALYRDALKLIDSPDIRDSRASEIQEKLGDVLTWTGQFESAAGAYEAALEACTPDDWIRRSCLNRKYAAVFSRTDNTRAEQAIALAEGCLAKVQSTTPEYWHEWIEVYLKRADLSYFRFDAAATTKWLDVLAPAIETSATVDQKLDYLHYVIGRNNIRDRFRPGPETIQMAYERLRLLEGAGDPHEIAWGHMQVGFVLQFAGRLTEADEYLGKSLLTAHKMGDQLLALISLNYLSLTHRRQNRPEDVQRDIGALTEALRRLSITAYEATARANRAWLSYRCGDFREARGLAEDALRVWAGEAHQFPAQWPAWTVLLALAVEERDALEARLSIEGLLQPHNAILAEEVDLALRVASHVCESTPDGVLAACEDALVTIKKAGYV